MSVVRAGKRGPERPAWQQYTQQVAEERMAQERFNQPPVTQKQHLGRPAWAAQHDRPLASPSAAPTASAHKERAEVWAWVLKLQGASHHVEEHEYTTGSALHVLHSARADLRGKLDDRVRSVTLRVDNHSPKEVAFVGRAAADPLDVSATFELDMDKGSQLQILLQRSRTVAQAMPVPLRFAYELHLQLQPQVLRNGRAVFLNEALVECCATGVHNDTLARSILCNSAIRVGNADLAMVLMPAREGRDISWTRGLLRNLSSVYHTQRGEASELIPEGCGDADRLRLQTESERDLMLAHVDIVERLHEKYQQYTACKRQEITTEVVKRESELVEIACALNMMHLEGAVSPPMATLMSHGKPLPDSSHVQAAVALEEAAEAYTRFMVKPARRRPVSRATQAFSSSCASSFPLTRRENVSEDIGRWSRALVADATGSAAVRSMLADGGVDNALTVLRQECAKLGVGSCAHALDFMKRAADQTVEVRARESARRASEVEEERARRRMRSLSFDNMDGWACPG